MFTLRNIIIVTVIVFCQSCNQEVENIDTNIRYDCPLCSQSTNFWCSDCGQDQLIWCKTMGNVNSLICENCGFVTYPYYNQCASCSKDCRGEARFWISKNNKNHPQCSF